MNIKNMMETISIINRNYDKLIKDKDDETSSKKPMMLSIIMCQNIN